MDVKEGRGQRMKKIILETALLFSLLISACTGDLPESLQATETANESRTETVENPTEKADTVSATDWYENLPVYTGKASIPINDSKPFFTKEEITIDILEEYSELDTLGRCGVAFANVCQEIMPTEEQGEHWKHQAIRVAYCEI